MKIRVTQFSILFSKYLLAIRILVNLQQIDLRKAAPFAVQIDSRPYRQYKLCQ